MLRSNLILCFLFLLPFVSFGQKEMDSSFFVRFATPIFEMNPGNFTGEFQTMSDSTFQFILAPYKASNHCVITDEMISISDKKKDTSTYYVILHWDKSYRLESMIEYPKDSSVIISYREGYISGLKPTYLALTKSGKIYSTDSSVFSYGKNGLVSSIVNRHIADNADTNFTERRLYDANNKVIVSENASYGTIRGTFTFEYDAKGNIARRVFMTRSGGAILCTDTMQYSYVDSLRTIMSCIHSIKIGNGNWVRLDEIHARERDGKPLYYAVYYAGVRRPKFNIRPNSELLISYDSISGKKRREERWDLLHTSGEVSEFFYSKERDSVMVYRVTPSYTGERELIKKEVRYYDGAGCLVNKDVFFFEQYYRKKKKQTKIIRQEHVHYHWSRMIAN